ncbi:MAG: ABC transporter substrate-binding protein [Gemmatimonadota bacterium]|nr:ABC transporter substrate-binding protein [Gemmatimonadota bacterium]
MSRDRTLAFALILGLIGGIVSACGGDGAGRRDADRNILHLSIGADPASLDPIQAVDVNRGELVAYMYDALVQFTDDEVQPNLAESWEISEDGTVYTFRLRDDVYFHNGRKLTAEDVVYSFERVLRPASASPLTWVLDKIVGADAMADGEAEALEGIRAVDPRTVEITIGEPYAPFLKLMAMPAAHVVPKEEIESKGEAFSEAPVGTGPWIFESWAHDDVMRLSSNPRYHGGAPEMDGIEIRIIPETTTVIAEFERGNLDWVDMNEFPRPEFERFAGDPEWEGQIHDRPALITYYLALNNSEEKFADPRVRRALNLAIDVDQIAEVIYPGEVNLSHGPIPPGLPGYREDGEPYGFDADSARALLSAAGADDLTFDVYFRTLALNQRFLEAVQANLADVGVTMNLQQRDWTAVRQSVNQGELDAYLLNWFADYPDAENFLYPLFYSEMAGAGGNAAFYRDATVDSLILTARTTLDDAERIALYEEADRRIFEDAPWIFTVHPVDYDMVQPWVEGYEIPQVFYGNKWLGVSLTASEEATAEEVTADRDEGTGRGENPA